MEVLTPQSPRWTQFTDRLNEVLYVSDTQWRCDGDQGHGPNPNHYRYAEAVMSQMGGVDIPNSIAFFQDHGGHCDCEILFNVDR
jgi:hypothetical protein